MRLLRIIRNVFVNAKTPSRDDPCVAFLYSWQTNLRMILFGVIRGMLLPVLGAT